MMTYSLNRFSLCHDYLGPGKVLHLCEKLGSIPVPLGFYPDAGEIGSGGRKGMGDSGGGAVLPLCIAVDDGPCYGEAILSGDGALILKTEIHGGDAARACGDHSPKVGDKMDWQNDKAYRLANLAALLYAGCNLAL